MYLYNYIIVSGISFNRWKPSTSNNFLCRFPNLRDDYSQRNSYMRSIPLSYSHTANLIQSSPLLSTIELDHINNIDNVLLLMIRFGWYQAKQFLWYTCTCMSFGSEGTQCHQIPTRGRVRLISFIVILYLHMLCVYIVCWGVINNGIVMSADMLFVVKPLCLLSPQRTIYSRV